MLLGFCDSMFEVGSIDLGQFFINALVYSLLLSLLVLCVLLG
jgi:hypothetical protein